MTDRSQFIDAKVHEAKEGEISRWRKEIEARLAAIETRIAFWGGGILVLMVVLQIATQWLVK